MKSVLILTIGLLLSISLKSQIYRSRAIMLTTTKDNDSSVMRQSNILIIYDKKQSRVKLYSPDQIFDITEYKSQKKLEDNFGTIAIEVSMVDQDALKCSGTIFMGEEGLRGFNIYYAGIRYSYFAAVIQ